MGSVALENIKTSPDRGVVFSDISLWAVWTRENIKISPDRGVVCSDIGLWAVWPLENVKTSLIEVLYAVMFWSDRNVWCIIAVFMHSM